MDKEPRERAENDKVATIGAGIVINGDVECTTDLQIAGRVNGEVRCPTLFLDETGVVKGTVNADRVRVSGLVDGGIETGDLAVESTGRVLGAASYARFKVNAGGVIEGTLSHRPEAETQDSAPLKLVEAEQVPKPRRVVYGE